MLIATEFATLTTSDGARESLSVVGLSASAESSVGGSESSVARANRREAFPERLRLRGWRRFDIPDLPLKSRPAVVPELETRLDQEPSAARGNQWYERRVLVFGAGQEEQGSACSQQRTAHDERSSAGVR